MKVMGNERQQREFFLTTSHDVLPKQAGLKVCVDHSEVEGSRWRGTS